MHKEQGQKETAIRQTVKIQIMNKTLTGVQERVYNIAPMERQVGEDGKAMFRGRAVVFNSWSNLLGNDFKEIIRAEAVLNTKMDRSIAVFNHDENRLLGTYEAGTVRLLVNEEGIDVEIDEANTSISRDCAEYVKRGEVRGMSFKFYVREGGSTWSHDAAENFYRHEITDIEEILDFSLVVRPAYSSTKASFRSIGIDDEAVKENLKIVVEPEVPNDTELKNMQIRAAKLKSVIINSLNKNK